jgi:uncharacterized protein YjbI with pentapeptide repeats
VVPVVPVCTYAHAREGGHVFAERVKKKTGTKWDRDQLSDANAAGVKLIEGNLSRAKDAAASLALANLNQHWEAA